MAGFNEAYAELFGSAPAYDSGAAESSALPDVEAPAQYRGAIETSARKRGLDPQLFTRVLNEESRFRPDIIEGRTRSRTGAVGIGQVMEKSHPDYKFGTGVENDIDYSSKVLSEYTEQFGGDKTKGVAAYNWGPGNLQKAIAKYGDQWLDHAPEETRNYVANIIGGGQVSPQAMHTQDGQFEQQYDQLFPGQREPYNPISAQPRRAALATPSASGFAAAYEALNKTSATPAAPDQGVQASDYARAFGSGAAGLGGAVAGIPEYLTRQSGRIAENLGASEDVQSGLGIASAVAAEPRQYLNDLSRQTAAGMTPEAMQRMTREWTSLDPGKTIWQGGPGEFISSLSLQATQAVPSSLATLLPGTLMLKAGLRGGAIAYLGASEGALSVGQIANNIAEEIEQAPEDELMQSQRYQELRQTMDPTAARQQLIGEAQGVAPAIGGAIVGMISATAGRYLEPKLTDVGSEIGGRFARGFTSEAIQESSQSAIEQMAQNFAAQTYDQGRTLMQGVPEQAVQGGAIGGLLGGATNAVAGPRRQALPSMVPEAVAPQEDTSTSEGISAPAASFSDVFGQGGAAPQPPADFGDVFTMPQQPSSFIDERAARDRAIADPQASQQRRSALAGAITQGQVNPDLLAAAAARNEGMIQDMFQQPNPMAGPGGEDMSQVWARNEQMQLPQPPPPTTDVVPADPQGVLPLTVRQLGIGRQPVGPPMAASPLQEDLSPPEGFAGPAQPAGAPGRTRADMLRQRAYLMGQEQPTFRDENQMEMAMGPQVEGLARQVQEAYELTKDNRFRIMSQMLQQPGISQQQVERIAQQFQQVAGINAEGFTPHEASDIVAPDEPSAEPLLDIQSQLEDLRDPDSERMGVYLSRANLEALRANGTLEQVRGQGVPLANFDGKGGVMIAKNRQAAEAMLAAIGKGTPMQEVLGIATGAGVGKPLGGANVVVQQRDEKGGVIRESLVENEEQADALAQAWEDENGHPTYITSAVQAQRRRKQMLSQEARTAEQGRETKRVGQTTEEAIESELGEGPTAERVRRAARGAMSENQSARNIVQLARAERQKEHARRFGDIDAPESLDFANPKQAEAYEALYNEYAGQEVLRGTAKDKSEALKVRARQEELQGQIAALREVAKPILKSERIARVASRISPEETTKMRREAEEKARPARSPQDFTHDVGRYTDEQVDALPEAELTRAFAAAAKFVAGRKRARATFEEITDKYNTPSEQRKLVKRVQNFLRRKEHGGKVAAVPLTRTAENKSGSALPVRKGKFDTRVLSVEAVPRELSREKVREIAQRAKKSFRHLEQSIHVAGTLLDKTRKGDFAKIMEEREPNGDRTDAARKMLLARAFLRTLAEYGNALQKANNRSSPAAIGEVERFNELIDKINGYAPKEFSTQLAKLYLAETRAAVEGAARVDPKNLGDLVYPNRRAASTAKSVQKNAERLSRIARIEQHWNTDGYYRNQVSPLMQKFVDSIARTGYMSYVPNVKELRAVQFAMRLWRGKETTRENLYRPIKRFFGELGVDIDTVKIGDDYQWEVPDVTLERKYRRRFGSEAADTGEGVRTVGPMREERTPQQQVESFASDIERERSMLARDVPLKANEVAKFGKVQAVNAAIKELRKTIQNGTTLDLIRGEETFVRQMGELGLWNWTNKKLGLGQVTLPGLLRDRTATVRLVTPRLRNDQMTVREARETMMELYQPVPLSREVAKETAGEGRAQLKAAKKILSVEDEIAERTRIQAMTPEQRKLMELFNRRHEGGSDLNMLDLPRHPEATFSAASSIAARLEDDLEAFPNAHELLDRALQALPKDSRLRGVVERLRSLPQLADVRVGYDRTGQILGDTYGRYSEVQHEGQVARLVQINRAKLDEARAQGHDPGAALMHVLTHELVHAATMGSIGSNSALRMISWGLLQRTSAALKERGIDPSQYYGVRDNDPREFIAEAFSNASFQQVLRNTYIEPERSVWKALLQLVKRVLGLNDAPDIENALDAVLSLTDKLFTGQPYLANKGTKAVEAHMKLDDTVRGAVGNVMDKYIGSNQTAKSLWAQAKDKATAGLLPAQSMEQLRDLYSRHFQTGSTNPMADYMRAFFKRNADNSANLERADKLSREWTEVTERNPEAALELSRIMTEATLHQMHPDLDLTDEENAHLTQDAQKRKHAELANRLSKLPDEMQDLYQDAGEYYESTLRREVALMTLNALRGYLTHGREAPLTEDEFDYTEGDVEGMGLNTMEGLREEFGGIVDEKGLQAIHNIASIPQQRKGAYFPLMRFGDFVVYAERDGGKKSFGSWKEAQAFRAQRLAEDPTLDISVRKAGEGDYVAHITEKEFRAAESRSEAESHRAEMVKQYGGGNVSPVQLKADLFRNEATINSNAGLKTILGKLDGNPAAQAAIKNFYLQSLADRSFRKHEVARKNRRGVDYETQHRTFANYAKSAAYYTSQLRFGWQMADALRGMEQAAKDHRDESEISAVRMGEVVREINARDKLTHDVPTVSKLVRGGVELGHFMLLTSPSYWMINSTQPYMVTLPWLAARSSLGDAVSALTNAQKLILSPIVTQAVESWGGLKALKSKAAAEKAFSVLEQVEKQIRERGGARAPEYLKMLTDLKRESIIDLSFIAELRDIASGKQSITQNVLDASRIMAHLTEVNNRIMTALASYDIGRAKGMEHESAVEFAKQAVSLTQFNYSSGNKPRLFQSHGPLGALGPLVFQFMQYPQHMYSLLISNMRTAFGDSPEGRAIARKTLAGIFATHMAAGGIIGAMLQPIKWAAGLAAFMFGDDNEPYDFDRSVREMAAELFGTELGEVVSAGLPRAVGVDLSQRMSLGTLYMVDLKTDNADSFLGSLLQSFGGPLTGMVANAYRGAQYARDGEWQKAFETVEPKFAKDVSKTLRYTSEGLTDSTGKTILEAKHLSPYQLFLQSIGLQPSEISETYARNQAAKDAQQYDLHRRESLLKRFRNASTNEERTQIAIEVAEFNKANPEAVITRSALLKSLTGQVEASQRIQALGGNFTGRQVLYSSRGNFADVDDDEEELENILDD